MWQRRKLRQQHYTRKSALNRNYYIIQTVFIYLKGLLMRRANSQRQQNNSIIKSDCPIFDGALGEWWGTNQVCRRERAI